MMSRLPPASGPQKRSRDDHQHYERPPGYRIDEVLGEVFRLTVRSRNVGSTIGASVKSLVGGELKGMTKMLGEGREHATQRLVDEAEGKGANAVIAFRFDTSELGSTWTEICAYGTAVRVTRGE
jgi:uncharacterized protein YbjQ (UPF0145 family)